MFANIFGSLFGAGQALGDVASSLVAFFQTITNPLMWRSIGWMLLGFIMMAAGAAMLLRSRITRI